MKEVLSYVIDDRGTEVCHEGQAMCLGCQEPVECVTESRGSVSWMSEAVKHAVNDRGPAVCCG